MTLSFFHFENNLNFNELRFFALKSWLQTLKLLKTELGQHIVQKSKQIEPYGFLVFQSLTKQYLSFKMNYATDHSKYSTMVSYHGYLVLVCCRHSRKIHYAIILFQYSHAMAATNFIKCYRQG